MFDRQRNNLKETNWRIPTDENGHPYFYYQRIDGIINCDENYIYEVWGDADHKPEEIEGHKIPFGSRFINRKTGALSIYNPPAQWDDL